MNNNCNSNSGHVKPSTVYLFHNHILIMKIRANNIDLIDAKRFYSFSSVIINCKKYISALIKSYCKQY